MIKKKIDGSSGSIFSPPTVANVKEVEQKKRPVSPYGDSGNKIPDFGKSNDVRESKDSILKS